MSGVTENSVNDVCMNAFERATTMEGGIRKIVGMPISIVPPLYLLI